jgi:mRNA interferase HicA
MLIIGAVFTDTGGPVKQSEFRRWLADQGATFQQGSKHLKVYLNGRQTTLPRHPAHEISEPLRQAILKQLKCE